MACAQGKKALRGAPCLSAGAPNHMSRIATLCAICARLLERTSFLSKSERLVEFLVLFATRPQKKKSEIEFSEDWKRD